MPVNILQSPYDEFPDVGIISRDEITYDALRDVLNVADWEEIGSAIIARRYIMMVEAGVLPNNVALSTDVYLQTLEDHYLRENAKLHDIFVEDRLNDSRRKVLWTQLGNKYKQWYWTLPEGEHVWEELRIDTARALQLNKYQATWQDIVEELQQLGVITYEEELVSKTE